MSKDEGLHCDFACLLYSKLKHRLPVETIYAIVDEAVEYEMEFITESLPVALIGMNAGLMKIYIKFCADRLIYALGYPKKYHVENPFDFVELISLQSKSNMFERRYCFSIRKSRVSSTNRHRISEYQKAGSMLSMNHEEIAADNIFNCSADF